MPNARGVRQVIEGRVRVRRADPSRRRGRPLASVARQAGRRRRAALEVELASDPRGPLVGVGAAVQMARRAVAQRLRDGVVELQVGGEGRIRRRQEDRRARVGVTVEARGGLGRVERFVHWYGRRPRRRRQRGAGVAALAALRDGRGRGRRSVAPDDCIVLHLARRRRPRRAGRHRTDQARRRRGEVAAQTEHRLRQFQAGQCRMKPSGEEDPRVRVRMAVHAGRKRARGQRGAAVLHRHRQRLDLGSEVGDRAARIRRDLRVHDDVARRIADAVGRAGGAGPAARRVAGAAVAAGRDGNVCEDAAIQADAIDGEGREGRAGVVTRRAGRRDPDVIEGHLGSRRVAGEARRAVVGVSAAAVGELSSAARNEAPVQLVGEQLFVAVAAEAGELREGLEIAVAGVATDGVGSGRDREADVVRRRNEGVRMDRGLRTPSNREGERTQPRAAHQAALRSNRKSFDFAHSSQPRKPRDL